METFKIPSDNLYKFICIGGLVLVISSYLSLVYKDQKYADQVLEYYSQAKIVGEEVNQLKSTSNSLTASMGKVSNDSLQQQNNEIINKLNSYELDITKVNNLANQLDYLKSDLDVQNKFLNKVIDIGFLFIAVGFILWYWKLQRYLDLIVKKQARESN